MVWVGKHPNLLDYSIQFVFLIDFVLLEGGLNKKQADQPRAASKVNPVHFLNARRKLATS